MNKILSAIFLIVFASLFFSACNSQKKHENAYEKMSKKNEIVIGVKEDSKPFGFIENGEFKGFDVDVAKYVFNKIFEGKPLKFTKASAAEKITKLNSEDIDFVVAIMSITPSREKIVDFSIPYFVAGQAILVKNNSPIKTIDSLNGQRVAVVLATTGEHTLREFAPNAIIKGCKSYSRALELLNNGDVSAVLGDDSVLYGIIKDNDNLTILNKRYTKEFYAIAFQKNNNNDELRGKINAVLEEMQINGEMKKIEKKWIPITKREIKND